MEKTEQLKQFFLRDKYVALSGIEIVSTSDEHSLVRAEISDMHLNAAGSVQGGMIFTLADFAFAVLANRIHPATVTSSSSITYLAPCRDTKYVTAESREVSRYRHNCVHEVIIRDDKGTIVAISQMNGFIKEQNIK